MSALQPLWPTNGPRPGEGPPEAFVLFETSGGRALRLASNLPYEVWLDGAFAGDGGHRCVAGRAALDTWDATQARRVVVRVHWIDPTRTTVYLRRAFADPFLAVSDPGAWTCALAEGLRASDAEASAQLPRQNIVTGPLTAGTPLALGPVERDWTCAELGIRRPRLVPVELRPIARLLGAGETPFDPCAGADLATAPAAWARTPPVITASGPVAPALPAGAACTTHDLGAIALHRVEATTGPSPIALVWSEVPDFHAAWATTNRVQVRLVDAVAANVTGGAPFGWRGGRYLHVLHDAAAPPELRAWRREYPIDWRPVSCDPRDAAIVQACRANLVACTDGGLVDTCWRERGQWTGDLRPSAAALRALATNDEPVALGLRQIAASYVEDAAMVQAVWPATLPYEPLFIPGYHLAWCLTALEHGLARVPDLAPLVRRSIERWRELYLRDGLLDGFPSRCWWFIDWDPERSPPQKLTGADAVTHAWFHETAAALGLPGIDPAAFERSYWTGTAWRLDQGGGESPQATAAAISAFPDSPRTPAALDWLVAQQAAGRLRARVTPYFGWFVARALAVRSRDCMLDFVRAFYGPRAAAWGTIPEKTTDGASLAHGWSVGVAALLVSAPPA